MPDPSRDREAIALLVEDYRAGFLGLDPARLQSIWDQNATPLIYVAQERAAPLRGWNAIAAYYAALPEHLESASMMAVDDLVIELLGDAALVFFAFRFVGKLKGREAPHTPAGRVTMVCRRTDSGWHVIHYHESAHAVHVAETSS